LYSWTATVSMTQKRFHPCLSRFLFTTWLWGQEGKELRLHGCERWQIRYTIRFASYVAKFPIQDLTSGFRAIKAGIAGNLLYLLPNTYSYPTTLTLSVLRSGRSLKYVSVSTEVRRRGKSKIKIFRDGMRFFLIITKICALYSPLRVFLPVSLFLFAMGLAYYFYTYVTYNRFTNMSALLFTTSVTIFMIGLVSEQISQMRFERSEGDKFI
jgi:hypothetical protein